MSTWPSDGRQEKESEEALADVMVRLLTAAGPGQQTREKMDSGLFNENKQTSVYCVFNCGFILNDLIVCQNWLIAVFYCQTDQLSIYLSIKQSINQSTQQKNRYFVDFLQLIDSFRRID